MSWLNEERVVAYARLFLACECAVVAWLVATSTGMLDAWGKPLGGDYLSFWSAGALALKGQAASAYDLMAHAREQAQAVPHASWFYFPWHYPPVFLLLAAPFALVPYGASLFGWLALTGLAFVRCVQAVARHRHAALLAVAWPGFLDNVIHGQNGFLSAALLGGGLALLETRPVLAGLLLGALCYKPQLAILLPIAFLAGGRWRVLAWTGLWTLGLCALATLSFGSDIWDAFAESTRMTNEMLEGPTGAHFGKVGVFSAVRMLGGSVALSWTVQAVAGLGAAAIVTWAWRASASLEWKAAVLVAAIPLAAPWLNTYDLVILALPAAWLVRNGPFSGPGTWERITLVALWLLPFGGFAVAAALHVQLAPAVAAVLVALLARQITQVPEPKGIR